MSSFFVKRDLHRMVGDQQLAHAAERGVKMAYDLQTLSDRAEISELIAAYSTALDFKRWDDLKDLFAADAYCDYGSLGMPEGPEAIVALISGTIGDLDATQHLVGNISTQVNGDTAEGTCYLISQHIRKSVEGVNHYFIGGAYVDRYVRTTQGWKFAYRRLVRMWTEGNRDVIARPSS